MRASTTDLMAQMQEAEALDLEIKIELSRWAELNIRPRFHSSPLLLGAALILLPFPCS